MKISILPSAIVDIVRIRCFYDGLEIGLGTRFQDYIFGEIDKLEDNAGIDEVHFGYYRALANRFHQSIYYKIDGDDLLKCILICRSRRLIRKGIVK